MLGREPQTNAEANGELERVLGSCCIQIWDDPAAPVCPDVQETTRVGKEAMGQQRDGQ